MDGPPAWELGEVLTSPTCNKHRYETFTGEMLALETKQSLGKLLPHSVFWWRMFPGEHRAEGRGIKIGLGMLGVFISQGPLRQQRGK